MKNNKKKFLLIMFILSLILPISLPIKSADEKPTLKVSLSADESIIVERILYTGLERIGYQMSTTTSGMRTAVSDVNYGDSVIVPAQAEGLDKDYPNLIRVPVPISYVETNAYTRSDKDYSFDSWDDLEGLRLAHRWQNTYVTRNVPRAKASEVITLNEYSDLWNSLIVNETDVAVIPNLTGFVYIVPNEIKLAGVIEREPRYTYVNKNHEYLVPLLTKAYQDMTDDGTITRIHSSEQTGDEKIVLHISSYSVQVQWERDIIESVRKTLEATEKVEYHNLNLNSRQTINSANTNAIIASTIRTNFIERNPDLVIVSDNDALEFVLSNYYMLFPKVPVVFCGINNFNAEILHGFENYITGVTEDCSLGETVEEMLRMYPKIQRIFVLNDHTYSGIEWYESIQNTFNNYNFPIDLEFSDDKPLSDILKDIKEFGSDTLVLIGNYVSDSNNAFYSEDEIQELVSKASNMPVFCLADTFNGNGSLGGFVSSGSIQGQKAADLANEILQGIKKPYEIPVITDAKSLNKWQFDYSVAKKFSINIDSLPKDHVILNRELPFWESNPFEFNIAIISGVSFLIVIIALAIFLSLMRQKNTRLLEIQSHLHSAEELLEKDNDLKKLIESLPVSVFIIDINICKPLYVNKVFLVSNDLDSFEQAQNIDLSHLVNKALDLWKNEMVTFNYGSLTDANSDICQKISVDRFVYNNKDCFVFISEDITSQLKEKEMLANAAKKEREANALKSIFLANMSHEIRTPMNAIIGLSQLALFKEQSSENKGFFQKISSSAKTLLAIINDILDFSKIEAEKLDLVEEEFELEDIISNAFLVAVDRIDEKPIEILLNMKPNTPCSLYGDSTRLWQVLKNILDNAVKYSLSGQIFLTVDVVNSDSDHVKLCFKVRDSGIGMTQEQLDRLYTPFEQLHQTGYKGKKVGTGLGMSITKQLVELMHGTIDVKSQLNVGTEFSITIPFKTAPNVKTIHDVSLEYAKELPDSSNYMLLVDDDHTSLKIMASLLEDIGVKTVTASNNTDALEIVKKHQEQGINFHTILIDYLIERENGLDLAKQIRMIDGCVRLFLVTAYMKHLISSDLLKESNIDDVIEKPFIVSEFMRKICNAKVKTQSESKRLIKYPKAKVLICEDIEINQIIAEGILNEFGISPTIVPNGQEALDLLETQKFDLILMDIIMPIMDGHETTIAIRQSNKAYRDTPICAMTANAMVDEVNQCLEEGMNAHLEKPIDVNALANVLCSMLHKYAE